MNYQVVLSAKATKVLDALEDDACSRILRRLDVLANDPLAPGLSKKLKDHVGLWRARAGAWRIVFMLDSDRRLLTVVAIGRRDQIYRRL